jgi:hypothetical protein
MKLPESWRELAPRAYRKPMGKFLEACRKPVGKLLGPCRKSLEKLLEVYREPLEKLLGNLLRAYKMRPAAQGSS